MNWKFTHIEHPARIALGLNISEYCVLDIIYQSQINPSFTKNGWTDAGCHRIAKFLGMAPSGVKQMLDRLVEFGMIEYADSTKVLKRTTKKWYDYAYLKEEGVQNVVGGVQNVRVQKVNGGCSESEHHSVQKVNGGCSESEHKYNISNNEPNLESKSFSKGENSFNQPKASFTTNQPEKTEEICANDVQTLNNSVKGLWNAQRDTYLASLKNDYTTLEALCRRTKYTTDQVVKTASDFAEDQIVKEDFKYPAYKDFKSHFYNWLLLNYLRLSKSNNQNQNGYARRNEGISPDRRAFVESLLD